MDFHCLSRKQLQALCKKNKIPANITNVAMADALAALDQVEGLDEVLNPIEADAGTPNVNLRTAGRASTQRKPARAEAEGSTVKVSASARSLRGARVGVAQGVVEQENKDANVPPVTPAAGRRRATAVSTRRKKEVQMVEEDDDKNDVPKTLAAASVGSRRATGRSVCTTKMETPGGTSVQRTYSTRRSVRLLENGLSKMSLLDTEDTGIVKIDDDVSQVSHQVEDSCDTEKGSSLQMHSTVVSEDTQDFEVCSLEQNTEYECQSHDSGSDVKLVAETEIDAVGEPLGSDEAEREKINCLELEAEPNVSDEAGSEPLPDLEETCDSSELQTENKECVGSRQESFPVEPSTNAILEVTGQEIADMVHDNVSVDVTDQGVAGSLLMITACKMDNQVSNKGGDEENNNNDQDVNSGDFVSLKELDELTGETISHEGEDKEAKNNEPVEEDESNDSSLLEGISDSCSKSDDQGSEALPVREENIVAMQDVLPSETSEDAPVGVIFQETATLTVVVADDVSDKDVTASLPMAPASDTPADTNESVECNIGDVILDMKDETENLVYSNMTDEDYQYPLTVNEKDAKESDSMMGSEGLCSSQISVVHQQVSVESASVPLDGELSCKSNVPIDDGVVSGEVTAIPDQDTVVVSSEGVCSSQISVVHHQVSVETASGPLDGELSCKSNVPVDDEVVSEEVTAIPDQDTVIVSSENVSSNVLVQSVVSDPLKENATSNDLHNKSMGELKRMLKGLNLGGEKSNYNKTNNKEVDKKRTALQALPQNRMTSGEAQIDG